MSDAIIALSGVAVGSITTLMVNYLQSRDAEKRRVTERASARIHHLLQLSIANYDVVNDVLRDLSPNAGVSQPVALTDEIRRKIEANASAMRALSRMSPNKDLRNAIAACDEATREMLVHRSLGHIRLMRDKYHQLWDLLGEVDRNGKSA